LAQLRACRAYCEVRGYTIVAVFSDEATTGTTDDRPQFQAAMDLVRSGGCDVFVVHKLDRWARDRIDDAIYDRELQAAGVRLESVAEGIDESRPAGHLMRGVFTAINDFYSRNLAEESMKGLRENAYQGRHNGGKPPLGYDVDRDGRYVVNEREAAAVRLIFAMAAEGRGYSEIIDRMTRAGYTTKVGKPFGKNSIHELLTNEKYIGVYVYNRVQERKRGQPRSSRRRNPEDKIVRVPGAVPAIIEEEVFRSVQEKLAARRSHSERARNVARTVYLLAGLVRCGECGSAYVGTSTVCRGKRYHYYQCGRRAQTRDCRARRIPKEDLEAVVLAEVRQTFFGLEGNRQIVADLVEMSRRQNESAGREMEEATKALAAAKREKERLIQAIKDGVPAAVVKDELMAADARVTALQGEIERLSAAKGIEITPGMAEKFLRELRNVYSVVLEGGDDRRVQAAIRRLVGGVEIQADRVILDLRINLQADGVGGPTWAACKVVTTKK